MDIEESQSPSIFQFARVLMREAVNFKTWVVLIFSVVSLLVLCVGLVYPKKYTSGTTIHADQQNIIKPLLEGRASTTDLVDHASIVHEVVMSPRLLKKVIADLELVEDLNDDVEVERQARRIQEGIRVLDVGPNFIKILFTSDTPSLSYQVVSKITNLFILDSSESKRKESRDAFLFIDKQVQNYKEQLSEAEENLKQFNANVDGTDRAVRERIALMRDEIESLELDIEETRIRISSLEQELVSETTLVEGRYRADELRGRIAEARSRLDNLKLRYTDDYPDVVALKQQIADMEASIDSTASSPAGGSSRANTGEENPLYDELRTRIATQKVELSTRMRRLERTEDQLKEEYRRLEKIAAQQIELSELNRDYEVTRSIYEDMLARKERARISMTLDVEGQGVTYRVQEPAMYPLTPEGLRFLHFFLAGPFVGLIVPIGLLFVYIMIDPRIRFRESIESITDVPILGVVPHISSPLARRVLRSDVILLGVFLVVVMCLYVSIALAYKMGLI